MWSLREREIEDDAQIWAGVAADPIWRDSVGLDPIWRDSVGFPGEGGLLQAKLGLAEQE